MRCISTFLLIAGTAALMFFPGCGNIEGLSLPYVASPRVEVQTPASPAEGDITITFQLIDREVEPADITVEYSTNGGTTYSTATLTIPADATNLASAWHPGKTHTVTWNSVTDMVGRSGAVSVCVKITPSDASNPSGTPGISGSFTVNNIAYNEAPAATAATPAGVQSGNVQINYFLADVESDTCSIAVLYSTNGGTSYQAATMGPAGDGLSGLSSSPSGTAHVYFWDSRADNVAPSGQVDTIRIRITPTDFNAGTAGDTNSFSVDNSVANDPPTVTITGGPADGSTVTTTQVTFTWSGSDTDGSVVGYYYSFDHDPPDVWTTGTTVTSGALSEASHIFRVVAVDDDSDLSAVASRSFTVSIPGTITADFSGSPLSGPAPLDVSFTDLSTATNGITGWSWDFGNGDTSTAQHPSCSYINAGSYTVSLTVTGPDGTDTETKTNYITVTAPGGDTIYVDGVGGDDAKSGLDWANAVLTIQTGLDKASDNWTVIVADGTYTGTGNKNLDFNGKAIHLKSVGGASVCTIDCENDGRGFYFHSGETNAAIVDGFTIQNGYYLNNGGGISCNISSSPAIINCAITGNATSGYGGGICCNNSSNLIIANCTISNNSAEDFNGGGIYCDHDSNPAVTHCTISNNSAGNQGGGIACASYSNPTILHCTISNNSADDHGGGIYCDNSSSLTITNCAIINNTATNFAGGGILCSRSSPSIANCTIANNTAGNWGGGIYCVNGCSLTLNNTILWQNSATDGNEVYTYGGDTVTLNICDYSNSIDDISGSGTVTPNNCITFNPLFVNATAQDYYLQDISPCVDAGDNSLVPPGITTDLDGNPRIHDGDGDTTATVDMGAYEFGGSPPEPVYGWTRRIGGEGYDRANAVCTDTGGNIYVAGYFNGTVNFAEDWGGTDEKTTNVGSLGLFITRVAANGDYSWTHVMDRPSTDQVNAMCVDANDNVYLTGFFSGNANFAVDWGGTDIKNSAGFYDIFVTKIDSNGSYCWTHRMGSPDFDVGYSICADGAGNVYVAGYFSGTVNFADDWSATDQKTSTGSAEAFVTKIDAGGGYCWTHRFGAAEADTAWALCTDDSDVYVAGTFQNTVNFAEDWGGSDPKTSAGLRDMFVTKIDVAGSYVWTRRTGGAGEDYPLAACADGGNNVYVTGCFEGSVDFADDWSGSDTKTSQGSYNVFVTKINSGTGYGWTQRMGGSGSAIGRSIWADAGNDVYVTGCFVGSANFAEDWGGTDTKTSAGSTQSDVFVTRIAANGSYGWTRRMGGTDKDDAQDLCVDASGNIYVAGFFTGSANFAEDWGGTDIKTSAQDSDIFVTKIGQP